MSTSRSPGAHSPCLTTRISIGVLAVSYLLLALTFSLMTRAYEADDEGAHVLYVEFIVRHDSIPQIGAANGDESHQPPLYYLIAAGWQDLLRIPAFTPDAVPVNNPLTPNRLPISHNYTASQHREAVYIHELRLLSILFGLATVLLAYAGARVIGMGEPLALSSGLFVALLPRELVVSSAVTNDALVVPLCALALVLFLLSERSRAAKGFSRRRLQLLAMGITLGAAAVTKFNSLPLAVILLALALVPAISTAGRISGQPSTGSLSAVNRRIRIEPRFLVDSVIAVAGFLAVSGWWFARNRHLYGQFLATKRTDSYLGAFFFLHPIPWSGHLLFVQVPQALLKTTWYAQPNLGLPTWMNYVLAAFAILCLVKGAWVILAEHPWISSQRQRLSGLAVLGCILGGLVAMVIVVKSSSIADARWAFVGLAPFALVSVAGSWRLVGRAGPRLEPLAMLLWPTLFLALDIYVLIRFLIPLGGL